MRALPLLYILLICQSCSLAGQVEKKAREGKAIPDLSRSFHNGHPSDDGRCEGGTDLTESSNEDLVDSALINGQSVRREPEHEPKRHVKTPQTPQEETIPSPTTPLKNAILDITDVDLRVFTISETFMGGILVRKTLTPNDGFRITEVLEMNLAIWTSSDSKEYAKSVVVHYTKDGSHLLSIGINNGHSTKPKCFEKNGSTWSEISDYAFFNKHDLMVEEYPDLAAKGLVPSGRSPIPSKQVPPREPKGDVVNTPLKPGGDISNAVKRDLNHGGEPRSAGHAREPQRNGSEPIPVTSPKFTKQIVLDITSPDSSSIDTFIRLPYEMAIKVYSAKDGYRISSVVDGGERIWTSSGHPCEHVVTAFYNGDATGLIAIYTRNKEGTKMPLYYKKVSSKWNTIEEDAFYRRFHLEAIKGSTLETLSLDIKGEHSPKEFYINNSPTFPFAVYTPGVGYRISAIKEGSTIIWNAGGEDQGCLYASFYPKTTPTLAYLIIHTSGGLKELFYSKASGSWKSVERDVYLTDLKKAGFNGSTFDNDITVDLSKPDEGECDIKVFRIDKHDAQLYVPFVGLQLKTIVDNGKETWKASRDERCTYINAVRHSELPFAFFIFVDDPEGDRKVLYFIKDNGVWKNVEKSDYHALMPIKVNGMTPQKGDGRIVMSSFRNKQGLKIATYSATVDNARANIILIHGIRSHFMSTFCAPNMEWCYDIYGFPVSLYINGIFLQESNHKRNPTDMHKHLLEHASLEGKDASLMMPAYEYEGSFIEFLNRLGYNAYGMDLQSYGLSEAISTQSCHVKDFKDYLNDLIQFVSIVRRGVFGDTSEKWNDATVFQNVKSHRKTILLGNSMGGNLVIQAVQEFYKEVKNPQANLQGTYRAHFVDGLISVSGMFSVDNHLDTFKKKAGACCLSKCSCLLSCLSCCSCSSCCSCCNLSPEKPNPYEKPLYYGESFDLFIRHREPSFKTSKLTLKTTLSMLEACDDVKKDDRMAYYPNDLPALIIHAKKDTLCDSKGSRDVVNKLNEKKVKDVKFIELDSSFHHLNSPQGMIILQPDFKEWLEQHT